MGVESWKIYKMAECVKFVSGGTPSKSNPEYWNGSIPWISCKDMKTLYLYDSQDHISEAGAANGTRLVPPETILIVVRGMILGQHFPVAMTKRKMAFNQDLKALQCDSKVDLKFLFYWLQGNAYEILGIADEAAHGTKRLQTDRLQNLSLYLPPLPIQRKIAAIFSNYDRLIENNTRRIEILEEMARSLYDEWFVKFRFPGHEQTKLVDSEMGLIPKEWEVKKIKEIIKRLKIGTTYKEDSVSKTGIVPVIDQSRNDFLGFHSNESDHFASPEKPIIIFGDHTCKMRLMIEPFSLAPNVVPFLSQQGIPIAYLYFLICNLVETKEYKRHWNDLTNKIIVFAPTEHTLKFASYVKVIFEQIDCLLKKNLNLRRTRELLLPKLISGEIDVENLDIETEVAV